MELIDFPSSLDETLVPRTIPDAEQRAHALDVTSSWITEAPAGSGKTGLLIQRYLKLLAIVDDPAQVLALTFTQKATAEMRERVLAALRSAAKGTSPAETDFDRLTSDLARSALQRDVELGWRLLDRPHGLNIRTIDSLCSEIARAMPLLSGSAGYASPVADAAPLYGRAAHAVMMRFGGDDAALNEAVRTVLLHRDGDLMYCERVLAEMLGTREQWGRLIPLSAAELDDAALDATVLPRLNDSLDRTLCASLSRLHQCFPEAELERVAAIARQLAFAEGHNGQPSAFAPCANHAGPPGPEAQHRDHWLHVAHLLLTGGGTWRKAFAINNLFVKVDKEVGKDLRDLIRDIESDELAELLHAVRGLPPATYPEEQWVVTKALFRLLQHALIELRLLFAREEVCDFSEVALSARAALKQNAGEVQVALGTELRHLLVDEMQDTSSGQYELLQALTEGWDGRSQTLFLVGDPKQSIYLFRQARVELFQRCMQRGKLGEVPLRALQLSANFRSGERIVKEFNETFTSIFPADSVEDGDVTYTRSTAVLAANDREGISWHMRLLPRPEDASASLRQRQRALRDEAADVATLLRTWRAQHPESKIAVLTRARSHVTEISKAIKKSGTPYRAVDIEALGERREVLDILSITRALLHPADRTAWLAVLHAPWCGAGLADLFRLAAGDDSRHKKEALRPHLRERTQSLASPMRERVKRTLDVMDAALQHAGTQSLADRVERTWRSLGGDACTDENGRENVRQFLRVLDEMEAAGETVSTQTLERRMERLFAEPSYAEGAVDVMTIHKAKGLEWDMVLVPGMHRISAQDQWQALDWLELPSSAPDGSRDVLLAPLPSKSGEAGSLLTFIRATRRRRANAEVKRLFYVAATRARTSVHLFAWPEATKDGLPADRNGTLLKAAWNAAAPHLMAAAPRPLNAQIEEFYRPEPLALAAAADAETAVPDRHTTPMLKRLQAGYDPLRELHRGSLPARAPSPQPRRTTFSRPEGSFGARAVGSTIHAFIERLANECAARQAAGVSLTAVAELLLAELPSWVPAIRATLRTGGLPPPAVERAAATVQRALTNLLQSPDGRWLLLPHLGAATESAWRSGTDTTALRVRLDRSFFAGAAPYGAGDNTLWIVDFKTGDHGESERSAFLLEERARYQGQLQTYAEMRLRSLPAGTPVMLALFYPLIGQLIYWPSADAAGAPEQDVAVVSAPVNAKGQLALFE